MQPTQVVLTECMIACTPGIMAMTMQYPARSSAPGTNTPNKAPGKTPDEPLGPVRVEVPMPRHLFDRLTNHDHAPRCRYDEADGMAEFVAAPGIAHESRAWVLSRLFGHLEAELADAGRFPGFSVALSTRLLSGDGAFEPDTCIFVDPARAIRAREIAGYLDTDQGHPVPDLVAEVDRSVDSSHKLGPYFRMGVREAWTWSAEDGAAIWIPDASHDAGFAPSDASRVFPPLTRDGLNELLADTGSEEQYRLSRRLAERIARAFSIGWIQS